MSLTHCPGCGRSITLPEEERDLPSIQCARCDTHFRPATGQVFVPIAPALVDAPESGGFHCPFCRYSGRPLIRNQISQQGWLLFVVMLISCAGWPFCWMPLVFMRDERRVCTSCGMQLG